MKKYLAISLSMIMIASSCFSIYANEPLNTNIALAEENVATINVDGINYIITEPAKQTIRGEVTLVSTQPITAKELVIPQTISYQGQTYYVTEIAANTFFGNETLEKISIPVDVEKIGAYAFTNCKNLKEINVVPGNMNYKSTDGVLFNKAQDVLISYPTGKLNTNYTLPSTVKKIENGAFYEVNKLTHLKSSTNLEHIGDYAFANSSSISDVSGILKLKTIGDYAFANSSLSSISLSTYVEKLGEACFYNTKIRNIEIPYRVTEIPEYAFYGTESLKTIKLPENLKTINRFAFANSGLENLSLPKNTNAIEYQAFANATNLKHINFNDTLQVIGEEAFLNCTSLTSLNFKRDLKTIGVGAFKGAINVKEVLGSSLGFIVYDNVLYTADKDELVYYPPKSYETSFEFPVQTSKARLDALVNMHNLEEITVPEKNEHLSSENGILYNKDKTKLIKYPPRKSNTIFSIPSSVEKIEEYAFIDVSYIEGYINIDKNVSVIPSNAFLNMPNLRGFNVYTYNEHFSDENGVLYNKDKTKLIKFPAKNTKGGFTLNSQTKFIEDYAFEGAELTKFTSNNKLETIGYQAFEGSNLSDLVLKDGLKTIQDEAFSNTKIQNVALPKSLENLGNKAFKDCKNLKNIEFKAIKMNSFGQDIFDGVSSLTSIVVPMDTYSTYMGYLAKSNIPNIDKILKEFKPEEENKQ